MPSDKPFTTKSESFSIGEIEITSGRLVLGDPPGLNSPLVLANVPNGRFPVVATVWEHPRNGSKTIAAVAMAFGRQSPSTNSETCEVTIDGATAMIADPRRWERFPDSAQKLIQKEIWREIKD